MALKTKSLVKLLNDINRLIFIRESNLTYLKPDKPFIYEIQDSYQETADTTKIYFGEIACCID